MMISVDSRTASSVLAVPWRYVLLHYVLGRRS
jgi:hypothetical protein